MTDDLRYGIRYKGYWADQSQPTPGKVAVVTDPEFAGRFPTVQDAEQYATGYMALNLGEFSVEPIAD